MVPRGLAKRYATALFNASLKTGSVKELRDEAMGLRKLFLEKPAYKNFLLSPQILTEDKKTLIDSTLGNRASDTLVRFLVLLIDKKRLFIVDEIIEAYNFLYEKHEGIVRAKVITAVPIDDLMRQRITQKLQQETQKKIQLEPAVDPEIIGGVIVIMDDKIIDGSIRHHLEKLRRDLDDIRVT